MMQRCDGLKPHIYPPLISQELWERCQAVRTRISAQNRPYKRPKREFLYHGIIHCANTGKICSCEIKKEQFTYIVCYDKNGKRKYIREQDVTDQIAYILHSIKIPEEMLIDFHKHLKTAKDAEIKFREAELTQLKTDLTKTLTRIDRLFNLYLDGNIDKETFQEKITSSLQKKRR